MSKYFLCKNFKCKLDPTNDFDLKRITGTRQFVNIMYVTYSGITQINLANVNLKFSREIDCVIFRRSMNKSVFFYA